MSLAIGCRHGHVRRISVIITDPIIIVATNNVDGDDNKIINSMSDSG